MLLPQSRKLKMLPLLILPLWLTACATAPAFNASKPATNPCRLIPVPTYDHDFNAALANEIGMAPTEAKFPVALQGCMLTRDAVRACAVSQ